jgi:hypothetical protein
MTEPTPMHYDSCEQVMDFLCAQFGEDEDSERCRTVKKHLEHCTDCTQYCDSLEKMIGLYRAAAPDFPGSVRDQLLSALGVKIEEK